MDAWTVPGCMHAWRARRLQLPAVRALANGEHEHVQHQAIRTHITLNFYSKKNISSLSARFSTLYHNTPQ